MKKILLLLLLFPLCANALSPNGLSDENIKKLELQAAQMKLDAAQLDNKQLLKTIGLLDDIKMSPKELEQLGTYGTQLGKVVTGFVKEIGLTISEFLNTPWGIVAVVLLAWHIFASDISLIMMSFVGGIIYIVFWSKFISPSLYTYINVGTESHPKFQKSISEKSIENTQGVIAVISFIIFVIIEIFIMSNIG